MTDIIETNTADRTTEYKTLVTPNFNEIITDVAKNAAYGWVLDPEREPYYNFCIYEVYLIRNADTIANAKIRFESATEGRDVLTKEKRVENAAKARETLAAKRAAKKEAGNEG